MTPQRLKQIRELCDAATQGKWVYEHKCSGTIYAGKEEIIIAERMQFKSDARFIAATDPATVRALIDEIERLRKLVDKFMDECESEMTRAEHKRKIADMDGHMSEVYHQEGRWHCAHDLAEFAQQALKGTDDE